MDINYANVLLSELYGIELASHKFEELALIAHNKIGNKNCRIYRFIAKPNERGEIELPCNCDLIEAVTTLWKDWNHVTNKDFLGDWNSAWVEQWLNKYSTFKDPLWVPGKYVKYERVGNKLIIDRNYGPLYVLYKGEILNDAGLPEVSEREADAIAAFIAYTTKYKQGLLTMNKDIIQVALMLKQLWEIKCDQAREDYTLSLNEWNEVLDVKSSWDRHQFGKSYHLVR